MVSMKRNSSPMTQELAQISGSESEWYLEEKSNVAQLDHIQLHGTGPSSSPTARADTFCQALADIELDALRQHHLALAMAVSELAGDSGSGLRWTQEDSIVVLLRAAATLAMTVPSATSRSAVGLIEQLGAAGQSATCDERPPTRSRSTVPPSPTMV